MAGTPRFVDDHVLTVGPTRFYCDYPLDDVPAGFLPVMKQRALVERYFALVGRPNTEVVVELGIRRGGSTALLHELTTPRKLIAIELDTTPAPALDAFIADRDLGGVVRPHYGVDQSDRTRLAGIVDDEAGGRPVDLVVDDASHLYDPTRSSFETLFPRLRPDGLFVLEDWNGDHLLADGISAALDDASNPWHEEAKVNVEAARQALRDDPASRKTPLLQLIVEFLLARASAGDAIRDVTIDEHWVVVRRGAEPLDPEAFRLSDLVHDHAGFTSPAP